MATAALLHLPALIQPSSPRAPSIPPFSPLCLQSLSLHGPQFAEREQLRRGRNTSVFCQHRPAEAPRRHNINTAVPVWRLMRMETPPPTTTQSDLQELGDKEPNGVPVGSAGERGRRSPLVPAQLGAEPLEEAQLLRRQPSSQHAF